MGKIKVGLAIGVLVLLVGCSLGTEPVMDLSINYTSWQPVSGQSGNNWEAVLYLGMRNEGRISYDTLQIHAEAFDAVGDKIGEAYWTADKLISHITPFRYGHFLTAELTFKNNGVPVDPGLIRDIALNVHGTSNDVKISGKLQINL